MCSIISGHATLHRPPQRGLKGRCMDLPGKANSIDFMGVLGAGGGTEAIGWGERERGRES